MTSSRNNVLAYTRKVVLVIAISLSLPSFAHDPFRDDHHRSHGEDSSSKHVAQRDASAKLAAARSLVISFRETGDDRNLDEAWHLLEPALESDTTDAATLITAAFVAQSRHEFDNALRLLTQALGINPNNDEARLLVASIHLVRGESESAAAACGQLRNVSPLVLVTCNARVALASGNQRLAMMRLQGVLNVVDAQHVPADLLAWSYSVAGDLAVGAGEAQEASTLYRRSLALAERTQVRAALVDVRISELDYADAWQTLDAGAPALPLVVRRLIVAKRLDRIDELQPELMRVQREFEAWIEDEDWLHAREMTRFFIDVVDRPDLARRLALINLELQREPEDLRLEKRTRSHGMSGQSIYQPRRSGFQYPPCSLKSRPGTSQD